jgi:hypothetical protein
VLGFPTLACHEKSAFLVHSLQGGGAERVILHLANYLDRSQYVPVLALGAVRGPYKAFTDRDLRLQRPRRKAYGNMYMEMARFYFSAGQPYDAMRHVLRGLWLTPWNCLRLIGYLVRRWLRFLEERPLAARVKRALG